MFGGYAVQAVLMYWRDVTSYIPPLAMFPLVAISSLLAGGSLMASFFLFRSETSSTSTGEAEAPSSPSVSNPPAVNNPEPVTQDEIADIYAPPLADLRKSPRRRPLKLPPLGCAVVALAALCLPVPIYALLFMFGCPNTEGAMFLGIGMVWGHVVQLPLVTILAIVFGCEWWRVSQQF